MAEAEQLDEDDPPVRAAKPVPEPIRAPARDPNAPPTVIVDNLHVTYRVFNAGRKGLPKGGAPTVLKRVLRGESTHGTREVKAIKGVSFVARRGESVGLIGRNGSGKSTLMRAVAGLLPPTVGTVYAEGQPTLLGVNAALMGELSGERNVMLGCLAMGLSQEQAEALYDEIVDFSGVRRFIDLPMRTYSSGMAQRLRFAIASARTPEVMLVDEALATGDKDFRKRSEERIRRMRDEAGTVFLVSHSLRTVLETCNRAIWLDDGLIKMDGDPEDVIEAYSEG